MFRKPLIVVLILLLLTACAAPPPAPEPNLDWQYGVWYQIFVKSFYDSTGDGLGDIPGITAKLDYLNNGNPNQGRDLGVNGIWLTPISPSPSYHKYDVTDYYDIDPAFGTLEDFQTMVQEAHRRGVKVIIDLVINHTSNQHPWFIDAVNNPHSPYRDWYIWASPQQNLAERGEWGQQVWHNSISGYYYGTFWSGMPDLNLDNPRVREEIINIASFWLEIGVDGFRLDAIKHIFPGQETKNREWWAWFRQELIKIKPNIYLVGEVWDNAHVVAPFYESIDSNFNFELADRLIESVARGRNQGIEQGIVRMHNIFSQHSPDFIDAIFLSNHDQNRVIERLARNPDLAKRAASLLLTLPGNPFIYYGEELGMRGRKPDEHIREPMLWFIDPSTPGQTNWLTLRDNAGGVTPSVEAQMRDKESLLNHYREMIHLRRSHPALLAGGFTPRPFNADNSLVSFYRTHSQGNLLVVHNLGNETLTLELDPERDGKTLLHGTRRVKLRRGVLTLPPGSFAIIQ